MGEKTPVAIVLGSNVCEQEVFFWNTKAGLISMAVMPRLMLKGSCKMNLLGLRVGHRIPGCSRSLLETLMKITMSKHGHIDTTVL